MSVRTIKKRKQPRELNFVGWALCKLTSNASRVQTQPSSSSAGGKQWPPQCVLQMPATIRVMSSASFCDTLLMAIICCPHKYDGLLKDPQDAA